MRFEVLSTPRKNWRFSVVGAVSRREVARFEHLALAELCAKTMEDENRKAEENVLTALKESG